MEIFWCLHGIALNYCEKLRNIRAASMGGLAECTVGLKRTSQPSVIRVIIVQSIFSGSNTFGTINISSRQG